MKVFLSMTFFIFTCSTFAQSKTPLEMKLEAEKALKEAQEATDRANLQEGKISESIRKQRKLFADMYDKVREEEDYLRQNEKEYSQKKGTIWGFFPNNFEDNFTRKYEDRKKTLKNLEKIRDEEDRKLAALEKDLEEVTEDWDKKFKNEKLMGNQLTTAEYKLLVAKNDLERELMDVKTLSLEHELVGEKLASVGLQLDRLKDKYDNTFLGAYIKDRMAKLINSDAFCDQAKACSMGKKIELGEDQLNSIFGGYIPARKTSPNSSSPVSNSSTR